MKAERPRLVTDAYHQPQKRVSHTTAGIKGDNWKEQQLNQHFDEALFQRDPRDEQAAIADEVTRIIGRR